MKRKLKWLAVLLAVFLVVIGVALFLWPRDRITAESWKMIRIGMPVEEVEGILGGSGLSEVDYHAHIQALQKELGKVPCVVDGIFFMEPEDVKEVARENMRIWIGQHGRITIEFDPRGHAIWKTYEGLRSVHPNFIDRLRDWLGW